MIFVDNQAEFSKIFAIEHIKFVFCTCETLVLYDIWSFRPGTVLSHGNLFFNLLSFKPSEKQFA